MKIKEIFSKAGPISDYFGYIVLLFGWYCANYVYLMFQPGLSGTAIDQVLPWVLNLLVGPIVLTVVFGGIHERQKTQDPFERGGFFSSLKSHLLRISGANLLTLIFIVIVTVLISIITQSDSVNLDNNYFFQGIISASNSTINLFWFTAIVVERKMFRGLARSIKTFLSNPAALAIGILWAVLCFADTLVFDSRGASIPLAINIGRSGVFAITRVLATMYLLVIYKNIWGSLSNAVEGDQTSTAGPGEKLAKTSLGFTFVSFVPLLHLVALILGVMALKRSHRFLLKAAIACCVGGFFTIWYSLLLAGLLVGQANHFHMPGYAFLANGNAELESYAKLLDQGAYKDVQAQLGETAPNHPDRHWAFDSALALAKYKNDDLNGALQDFYTALQKKPERSEFYFYYGMALLDNEKEDMAMEQFKLALEHQPKLDIAEKYIALVQNEYQPSRITSALMYFIILILLFTVHEYGHAFAAWKLGDDTAKSLGRLTLNPAAHLDIFGSILLPAALLLQQAGVIFGWAKPVPVNLENFKNPRKDHMLVSFAGPAVNLVVAMVCMIGLGLIGLFLRVLWPGTISLNLAAPFSAVSLVGPPLSKVILIVIVFLKQLFYTSLILGFFNLIPVPPLDGFWIFAGVLPQGLQTFLVRARQFSFVFFLLLMMTPVVDYFLSIPIGVAWIGLKTLVSVIGFA